MATLYASNLNPSSTTIAAGYSVVLAGALTLITGVNITIGLGANLRIL